MSGRILSRLGLPSAATARRDEDETSGRNVDVPFDQSEFPTAGQEPPPLWARQSSLASDALNEFAVVIN